MSGSGLSFLPGALLRRLTASLGDAGRDPRVPALAPRPSAPLLEANARRTAATLPPLLVAASRVAATVAQGVHGRRRVGQGDAFWQFRQYASGDSTSRIDWRQSAKRDRLYVRENEWEAAQSVWLWRDRSPGMAWRSLDTLPTKRERAELIVMATAVLLVQAGERVALLGEPGAPSAVPHHLDRLAVRLTDAPDWDSDRQPSEPAGTPVVPRHAQVVLIGDFLGPIAEIDAALSRLVARGVRGHLVQVLDPAEETLPYRGRVAFEPVAGPGHHLVPRVDAIRTRYLARLAAQREALGAAVRAAGWSMTLHSTDQPPERCLLALYMALSGAAPAGRFRGMAGAS